MTDPANIEMISVILPVYNGARYLERAVSSVLRQTYDNFELIIADDASDDGTDEIARSKGAVVRYDRQQGKGNVIRSMFTSSSMISL